MKNEYPLFIMHTCTYPRELTECGNKYGTTRNEINPDANTTRNCRITFFGRGFISEKIEFENPSNILEITSGSVLGKKKVTSQFRLIFAGESYTTVFTVAFFQFLQLNNQMHT